jgi:hypothetical protein
MVASGLVCMLDLMRCGMSDSIDVRLNGVESMTETLAALLLSVTPPKQLIEQTQGFKQYYIPINRNLPLANAFHGLMTHGHQNKPE